MAIRTKNIETKGKKQPALFLPFVLFIAIMPVYGQQILVCNAETRFPLRDVEVRTDGKLIGKTIYLGTITLPDSFRVATFSKPGYIKETLRREEVLRDTMFLFPAKHSLEEVVVTAKYRVNTHHLDSITPKRDLKNWGYTEQGVGGYNFFQLFDKRLNRDHKHTEQNREIFKKMDGGDDPILRAYTKEKEKQDIFNAQQQLINEQRKRKEEQSATK